jgi:signal transduction histidine kinase
MTEPMEELLSIVRHQFGNTVNALQITMEVLQENYTVFDDEKRQTYFNRLFAIVAQQQTMIDALKSYSIYDLGERSDIFFPSLWDLFLETASELLERSNIVLNCTSKTPTIRILGNTMVVKQVLMSVLENAIEALEDTQHPEITIDMQVPPQRLIIEIADNGPGIDGEDLGKVFIPLFTTKRSKNGMGLAIARKLLQELTGRIEIDSVAGHGTKVRIQFKAIDDH